MTGHSQLQPVLATSAERLECACLSATLPALDTANWIANEPFGCLTLFRVRSSVPAVYGRERNYF